jgi:hypothetical protein
MSGATEEEQQFNMDKIVKNIIREVKIDKNKTFIDIDGVNIIL